MSGARASTKLERRLALLEAGGEPNGTGTPCADCEVPRTALNTSVIWSDQAKTRLTFHYTQCATRAARSRCASGCATIRRPSWFRWALKQLEGTSDVTSVAVFEDEQGGLIAAGYEDGTIKVWDSGAPKPSKSPLLGQN